MVSFYSYVSLPGRVSCGWENVRSSEPLPPLESCSKPFLQCDAPTSYKLVVYKPHEYHSYLRIINRSEIGDLLAN